MLWLKILLKEIGCDSKDSKRLYCDNKALILLGIQFNVIKPSILKLTNILLKKNSERV
jgi:hypothetical protein